MRDWNEANMVLGKEFKTSRHKEKNEEEILEN